MCRGLTSMLHLFAAKSYHLSETVIDMRVLDMRVLRTYVSVLLILPALGSAAEQAPVPACAPAGVTYTRTTLYFGLARPAGTITEREWKTFVRDEIMPRFPQGFTIWQADGQ